MPLDEAIADGHESWSLELEQLGRDGSTVVSALNTLKCPRKSLRAAKCSPPRFVQCEQVPVATEATSQSSRPRSISSDHAQTGDLARIVRLRALMSSLMIRSSTLRLAMMFSS